MRTRVCALGACLAALGGGLSACSLADADTATHPRASFSAGNAENNASSPSADPWTLPIEARPDLFNPCTEVAAEDLAAAGLDGLAPWPEAEFDQDSPYIKQCGWKNEDLSFKISSAWSELEEFSPGEGSETLSPGTRHGFESALFAAGPSSPNDSCFVAAKTNHGLVTFGITAQPSARSSGDSAPDTCALAEGAFDGLVEWIDGALR